MGYRIEKDTLGEVRVPDDHYWGAQTERSFENFRIGTETMPKEIIEAFALLKQACAEANHGFGRMDDEKYRAIVETCDRILAGEFPDEFPLKVWQTGSGTQSNMNVNEVIAHVGGHGLHPNDHVNMSQSSNDTFPSALHIAGVLVLVNKVLPAIERMRQTLLALEEENKDVLKSGRTHLMDAVPIRFSQEISGWRGMLEESAEMITLSLNNLHKLAIGGTAVGTGINAPAGFDEAVCTYLSTKTGVAFIPDPNKFHALTSKDACVFAHGALKGLAADLMKIANDVRWMASGPRDGLGEITIPANEPGSSIMPGKVNPTQCEAVTMVAVQVMGNDTAIGIAASQGNFELNVFMPVIAYNFIQSAVLLADVMDSFVEHCLKGLKANKAKMRENLERSLMSVTALNRSIGYEKAATVAKKAFAEDKSLKEAVLELGYLSEEEFDRLMVFEKMV
ncbi:MAG: class II fumarate hydratase [Solobacterium sp.]|nr:class II fumarate hydratase [Solobacterium sp.]